LADALEDDAVQVSGVIREVEAPYGGRYRIVTEPLKMSAAPLAIDGLASALGEHTREVLSELGLSGADVDAMLDSGAAQGCPSQ
jgi:crotonobetainyl-CoA:carnitine CoA-transferase CaiB-like acyl-CoA transferase